MKRIQIVGLCLVAVFALSALATSSASAAEYGQCRELSKNTTPKTKKGKYIDAGCKTTGKKGKYEWYPGPAANCIAMKKGEYTDAGCSVKSAKAKKGHFELQACAPNCAKLTTEGGKAHLEGETPVKIECEENGSVGAEILSPTEATGRAVYHGCHSEALGGVKCTTSNEAAASGEIKTTTLKANPEVKGGNVWVNYSAKSTPFLAEFECAGAVELYVTGSAAGESAGNTNVESPSSTETFGKIVNGIEGQKLKSEKGVPGSHTHGEPENSWQIQSTKFNGAPGEIRN